MACQRCEALANHVAQLVERVDVLIADRKEVARIGMGLARRAVEQERERCARLVEGGSPMSTMKQTLEWLAREIREGTK